MHDEGSGLVRRRRGGRYMGTECVFGEGWWNQGVFLSVNSSPKL